MNDQQFASNAGESDEVLLKEIDKIAETFPMKDSPGEEWLGSTTIWTINKDDPAKSNLRYGVKAFIEDRAKKHSCFQLQSHKLPMDTNTKLQLFEIPDEPEELNPDLPYRKIVGDIVWIVTKQFKNLTFHHNVLSRYLTKFTK